MTEKEIPVKEAHYILVPKLCLGTQLGQSSSFEDYSYRNNLEAELLDNYIPKLELGNENEFINKNESLT